MAAVTAWCALMKPPWHVSLMTGGQFPEQCAVVTPVAVMLWKPLLSSATSLHMQ